MQRVAVGRTVLIAGLCALIPLGGNVVASFLTVWTGGRSWLVVPGVGVTVAMVTALVQAYSARQPQPATPYPDSWPGAAQPRPRAPARRGTPLPAAILIAVLAIGLGGWGVAMGARYAVGYVTGNESGTEQLKRPARGTADGLTLTVESVQRTAHFTRVKIAARSTTDAFTFRLFLHGCVLRGADGSTIEADMFRSRWTEELSPRSLQRGTVTFKGHLPGSVKRAELSFNDLFSFPAQFPSPGPGPSSITVRDIRLRPTEAGTA